MMDSRKLILKRGSGKNKALILHDAQTGEPLASQKNVQVIQDPFELTRIVVTFIADKRASNAVRIQCDDLNDKEDG